MISLSDVCVSLLDTVLIWYAQKGQCSDANTTVHHKYTRNPFRVLDVYWTRRVHVSNCEQLSGCEQGFVNSFLIWVGPGWRRSDADTTVHEVYSKSHFRVLDVYWIRCVREYPPGRGYTLLGIGYQVFYR